MVFKSKFHRVCPHCKSILSPDRIVCPGCHRMEDGTLVGKEVGAPEWVAKPTQHREYKKKRRSK